MGHRKEEIVAGLGELWDEVDGADASVIESSGDGVGGESVVCDGCDFVAFRPFCDGSGDFEIVD